MDKKQSDIETVFQISEERLEELRTQAREKALSTKHSWRQRGGYIACDSCIYPHAFRVNGDTLMKGIDENGIPVLERRAKPVKV